ncbi:hypothetical protein [Lacrimispora sp.]|uniref:hypothetical protein n=1 Tax=Lacrimispora sp. TaxID=2719234 RepID=UPI0028A64A51|nr:hypothetical protein [Lacrimispora sp.]
MAGTLLRIGDKPNVNMCEFVVDTEEEIEYLPTTKKKASGLFNSSPDFDVCPPIGSTCCVGNENGDLIIYMLFTFGWRKL